MLAWFAMDADQYLEDKWAKLHPAPVQCEIKFSDLMHNSMLDTPLTSVPQNSLVLLPQMDINGRLMYHDIAPSDNMPLILSPPGVKPN
jgi:hypothetical protein